MIPDVFKNQCRAAKRHIHARNRADFLVPVDARADAFELPGGFQGLDPGPEVRGFVLMYAQHGEQ